MCYIDKTIDLDGYRLLEGARRHEVARGDMRWRKVSSISSKTSEMKACVTGWVPIGSEL